MERKSFEKSSGTVILAAFLLLQSVDAHAQPQYMQSGTRTITPNKLQIDQLALELQLTSLQCEQKVKALAQQVFETAVAFRLKEKRFAESIEELKSVSPATSKAALPPPNPFVDAQLVSKDLHQELINTGNPPSDFCKIILEQDSYVSAGFPLTLKTVKLKPVSSEPGAIVVKYNGDYYLAVWCMGISGKPLLEEKTQLPFILFKDFSQLSE